MKKIFTLGVILTLCHFLLFAAVFMISLGSGWDALDEATQDPTRLETVADSILSVLSQPAISLWTPWMSRHLPDVCEWIFLLANSIAWGFCLAIPICLIFWREKKNADNNRMDGIGE